MSLLSKWRESRQQKDNHSGHRRPDATVEMAEGRRYSPGSDPLQNELVEERLREILQGPQP